MVPFYHTRVFERVNIALLDLFDRIRVNRYNRDGTVRKRIKVPLTFHFSKNFANFILNTQDNPESKHTTPIIGLRMGGLSRNGNATTSRTFIREIYDSNSKQIIQDMRPCPWIQSYTLTSYTELIQDHFQIMEQIIPYFNPTFNTTIKEFEFSNLKRDIIVELEGVDSQYNDEVEREKARSYLCNYTFNVRFDMYAPLYIGTLIKEINNKISISNKPIKLIRNIEKEDLTVEEYNDVLREMIHANESISLGDEEFQPSAVSASHGKRVDTIVSSGAKVYPYSDFVKFFDVNSDRSVMMVTLPPGSRVLSAYVAVIDAYNDPSSAVEVGVSGNTSMIMSKLDSNLSICSKYEIEFDNVYIDQHTDIYVTYNRGNATNGSFEVSIKWI